MLCSERKHLIESKHVFISCVVPVYNEVELIIPFFTELQAYLRGLTDRFEIIAVDDGSRDQSLQKLLDLPSDYCVKVLGFSRNFGKETALTAGLEHCSGDVAILMDADFQHPLDVLPLFLQEWSAGYNMVYGVRRNRDNESAVKRHLAHLFYWIMSKITKIDIPMNAGDFRLLDRCVIDGLNRFNERNRFMKGMYAWVGFKRTAVHYDVKDRPAGKSSWGLGRLTELAITGIASFSDIPLRVWGMIGFVISFISLVYAIYIVTVTLVFGADLPGFPTLAVAIMFFGGVQLLSIGILGEYIARIFTEVKRRPNYLIEVQKGFD